MEIRFRNFAEYEKWLRRLSPEVRGRVTTKIDRLAEHGLALGMPLLRRLLPDLFELRVDKYRLYFTVQGDTARFLVYGDKGSQQRDIQKAQERLT